MNTPDLSAKLNATFENFNQKEGKMTQQPTLRVRASTQIAGQIKRVDVQLK
jgi:hypothetical protein